MPVVLTAIATTLFAGVLVALWVLVLRPIEYDGTVLNEVQRETTVSPVPKVQPTVMALMVLSWSEGLRAKYEEFLHSSAISDSDNVVISTKYAAGVVKNAAAVVGYLDSLASRGGVDEDKISLASLPSVLRNGFENAKHGTLAPFHVVVMGGFPRNPSEKEYAALASSMPILADDDFLWLAKSSRHKLTFICETNSDAFRQSLQAALDSAAITYQTIY